MDATHYSAACYAADRAAPYLAVGRATLRVVWTQEVPLAGADEHWRLYLNPDRFPALPIPEAAYVLLHEVGHVVRKHGDRRRAIGAEKQEWNIAADAELNSAQWPGLACPAQGVTPDSLGMPPGLLAEDYHSRLREQAEKQQSKQRQGQGQPQDSDDGEGDGEQQGEPSQDDGSGGKGEGQGQQPGTPGKQGKPKTGKGKAKQQGDPSGGQGSGSGSASDGERRPWELDPDDTDAPGLQGAEAAAARMAVAAAIREYQAGHGRGDMLGGWGLWAESVLSPVVPWNSKLRAAVTSGLSRIGLGSQSYSRVRERNGVCLPRHVRRVPSVVIVADTSGSMGSGRNTPWHRALSESIGIARAVGSVTVVWCDMGATIQRGVRSLRDVRPTGGGGTDMRIGIAAADALRGDDRPDVIITITDGETPWPKTPPRAKHIAVIVRDGGSAPLWGETVRVE
jgi:predicted metal-dependent peptidase